MKNRLLILNLILISLFACGQNRNNSQLSEPKMNLKENAEIKKNYEILSVGMTDFIQTGETKYTKSDVEKCMSLIDNFLYEISKSESKDVGILSAKKVVLALNELNQKCEHELIETEQREQIADIIILAGHLKGYNGRNEDITEEWREW